MIALKLMGGLGNQMFQYALGRHLAIKNNTKLILDLSFLNTRQSDTKYTIRDFELNVFEHKATYVENFFRNDYLTKLMRRIQGINYISEDTPNFNSEILSLSGNLYFAGFWQSELYFKDIREQLLNELSFKPEISANNLQIVRNIRLNNSVSLHIRRGDYTTSESLAYHGVCPLSYYKLAIDLIKSKVANPIFFIFSDDFSWVEENFVDVPNLIYVQNNSGKDSFKDMQLMTLCKHNIIANSSFSWWGAWLNQNPEKIVIAPKTWFIKNSPSDIVPNNWTQI